MFLRKEMDQNWSPLSIMSIKWKGDTNSCPVFQDSKHSTVKICNHHPCDALYSVDTKKSLRLEDCGIYETIGTQNIWFTAVTGARPICGKQRGRDIIS